MMHGDRRVKFSLTQFNSNSYILHKFSIFYMPTHVEAENGVDGTAPSSRFLTRLGNTKSFKWKKQSHNDASDLVDKRSNEL